MKNKKRENSDKEIREVAREERRKSKRYKKKENEFEFGRVREKSKGDNEEEEEEEDRIISNKMRRGRRSMR